MTWSRSAARCADRATGRAAGPDPGRAAAHGVLPVPGLIAPEFAGVDLGLAEKLAIRAVAAATGTEPGQATALVRETGDLGQAAEQLLTATAGLQPGWRSGRWWTLCTRSPRPREPAHRAASQLLAGLLAQATPLEARYLLRLVTGSLRLGIGMPTILDALAQVYAGGRAARPALERAYNICCDLGQVAATLTACGAGGGRAAPGPPGQPGAGHARPAAGRRVGDLGQAGRASARPSTSTTASGSRRTAPPMAGLSCSPAVWSGSATSSPTPLTRSSRRGWVHARRSWRERSSPTTRPPGSCIPSRKSCSGAASTASPRRFGTCRWACFASSCSTPTARTSPGRPTPAAGGPGPGDHRLAPAAADHRHRGQCPAALDAAFEQAVTDGCEGLVCKSVAPDAIYQAGRRGLVVDQAQAGLPHRTVRHHRPGYHRRVRLPRPPGLHLRPGAARRLLPGRRPVRAVTKCFAGFSDAELAALPARLAPLASPHRPARVDARQEPDVWFEPGSCWRSSAPSSPCRRTTPPPGARSNLTPGWPCAFPGSPGAGATTRRPKTPPPPTNWPTCTAPPGEHRPAVSDEPR